MTQPDMFLPQTPLSAPAKASLNGLIGDACVAPIAKGSDRYAWLFKPRDKSALPQYGLSHDCPRKAYAEFGAYGGEVIA